MKGILAVAFIAVLCLSMLSASAPKVSAQQSSGDWPMFRADPSHSGAETGSPIQTPTLLWNFTILTGPGVDESSPAVVNDILYVGSANGNLYALNATNGDKIWNYSTGGAVSSSPAVVNGVVYVGSFDDDVYALNATNGDRLWSFDTGNGVYSSPTVTDGTVYVASDNVVYALNAASGIKLWNYTARSAYWYIDSSPAVANGVVYIGSNDHDLYALDAANGTQLWVFTFDSWVYSSPAVANGIVYVGGVALNAFTGKEIWSHSVVSGGNGASPAVADGVVYLLDSNSRIDALKATSGQLIWSSNIIEGSPLPIVAGNVLYTSGAITYALNATTGETLWSYNNTGLVTSSPAYANGVIYLDSTDGNVYALGIPSPATQTVQEFSAQPLILAVVIGFIIVVTVIFLLFRKTLKNKPDDRYKYKLSTPVPGSSKRVLTEFTNVADCFNFSLFCLVMEFPVF